ncbi:MAG: CBS domain-containing protein [Candidatus Poribacteria bacterium]|nr:CBS domain-containing protein [Candidatus Poribacteria bacterium]
MKNPSQLPNETAEAAKIKPDSLAVPTNLQQKPLYPARRVDAKPGLFGKRKRKSGPMGEHIRRIVFENIDALPEGEARMLHGIFSLSRTTVREVMIPLSEMMAVHIATPTEQVKAMARHNNYQYIPTYEERIDRLTGIVNIMDILYATHESNELGSFVRTAYYVPETKLTGDLLDELRAAAEPVAVVIDEHGGCVGFVSLEDILEQIVGEIGYNHKRHALHVEQLGNNSWALDARTPIDIVNVALGLNIPKDRCDTIGGFILKALGRLPDQGEKVSYSGIEFTVAEVFGYGIAVIHANQTQSTTSPKKR